MKNAVELDTGSYKSSCVKIILFVSRLAIRVESFISFLLQNSKQFLCRYPEELSLYRQRIRTIYAQISSLINDWLLQAQNENNLDSSVKNSDPIYYDFSI